MTPDERRFTAAVIKAAREARGWTRAEAARQTGIPLVTLEKWERGERSPKPYSLPGILERIRTAEARP